MREREYAIPGFAGYVVRVPDFAVVSKYYGRVLSRRNNGDRRGYQRLRMLDDDGKERALSVLTLAALAFHGQCPVGYLAFHSGGDLTPQSVQYLPEAQVYYLRKAKFTMFEALTVLDMYFDGGMTQAAIARKMNSERKRLRPDLPPNILEADVWYVINRSPFSPYVRQHERARS